MGLFVGEGLGFDLFLLGVVVVVLAVSSLVFVLILARDVSVVWEMVLLGGYSLCRIGVVDVGFEVPMEAL